MLSKKEVGGWFKKTKSEVLRQLSFVNMTDVFMEIEREHLKEMS